MVIFDEYIQVVQSLKKSFEDRFKDIEVLDRVFSVFAVPFSVPANSAPDKFQVELIYCICRTTVFLRKNTELPKILFYFMKVSLVNVFPSFANKRAG